ncbi:MAG: hypothetical protein A2516_08720 [Alphaproteobacteria bacterium RIFOXYD12_FULL_60_8]|nr:MAG: hypothetical protein A2516_08720 [Alphaproteobacteria bacterium RIFOXYD12_FULL_60_8]
MSIVLAGIDEEILCLARSLGVEVAAVSDTKVTGTWRGYRLYPSDEELIRAINPTGVIICIDAPHIKAQLDRIYRLPPVDLIGGSFHESSSHGSGLVLQQGALVSTSCNLGRCVKININATVMHDARIGDYVTIAPAAVILGRVTIGAGSFIGANATLLPEITIGENAIVGAGSVVTKNVPSGTVVKGVPAK